MNGYQLSRLVVVIGMAFLLACQWGCRGADEAVERVLYIGWDAEDREQLFVVDVADGRSEQLTAVPEGVIDYAVLAGGDIVFAAWRRDGGSDLWRLAPGQEAVRLLDCAGSLCSGPVWAPEGGQIIFEERPAEDESGNASRLWWLEMSTGATQPVIDDPAATGRRARFSADGAWLSFFVPNSGAMQIIELASGRLVVFPSQASEAAAWHPTEPTVLIPSVEFDGERAARQLLLLDLTGDGTPVNLSGDGRVDDSAPAWSPDGAMIAVARGVPRTAVGRQLYLLPAAGGEAQGLTAEPTWQHGRPRWSADGRALVYQRFSLADDRLPEVWLIDVGSGEQRRLAGPGFRPEWVP